MATPRIPPGGEGKISVKVDTTGYGGRKLSHLVLMVTNDPERPEVPLTISGPVMEFVRLNPRRVQLTGKAGEIVTANVEIIPVQPFKILGVKADPGNNIRISLGPGKREGVHRISIENISKGNLTYYEKIVVRTDHPERPEFTIPVQGALQP